MNEQVLVFAVDETSYYKEDHIGVRKKVEGQLAAFRKNGIKAELMPYKWENGLPTIRLGDDVTILYFRRMGASFRLARMLKGFKRDHPHLKIIMEIPIYPFNKERDKTTLKGRINEFVGRSLWCTCVDRIVLVSNNKKRLYGIPVMNVNNGIDFDSIRERKIENRGSVNMIAVSGCYFWHGYDRLLEGMGKYYSGTPDREVNLYLVGEGSCSDEYRELSARYDLKDKHVFFCGILDGEKLDEVYDKCDIAIDCFGAHRKGLYFTSSLKSREYAAKGMPIVSSIRFDIENDATGKYFLRLPADESAIDIQSIVRFYDEIYPDGTADTKHRVADEIRAAFRPLCDISMTYGEVMRYMKG